MNTLKKVLALTLALVMMFSVASFAEYTEFADLEDIDERCVTDVKILSSLNILNGFNEGDDVLFKGTETITRAQAAKMIYVIYNGGVDDGAEIYKGMNIFSDIKSHWAEGYINACYSLDIVAGRGQGIFDPDSPVTGDELAKMLLVLAKYRVDVHGFTGADWAKNVANFADLAGLLDGYNYRTTLPAPRQWAAKMFVNALFKCYIAEYIGDNLVTGAYGSYFEDFDTVGWKYMNLQAVTAYVVRTENLDASGAFANNGAALKEENFGVYKNGKVALRTVLTAEAYEGGAVVNNEPFASDFSIHTIDYIFDNSQLGHQVMIVFAGSNLNSKTHLYGVFETGNTVEYETDLDELEVNARTGVMTFGDYSEVFYGEETDDLLMFMDTGILPIFDAAMQWKSFSKTETSVFSTFAGEHRTWPVKFIDMDGNGYVDIAFVTDSYYGEVTRNNTTRGLFTVEGNLWDDSEIFKSLGLGTVLQYADYNTSDYANLVGAEDVNIGDVIKLTVDVTSGTLQYVVEAVDGVADTVIRKVYGPGGSKDFFNHVFTIGDEKLSFSENYFNDAAVVANNDIVYYTDGKYIVAAYEQDTSAENLTDKFAIVMDKNADAPLIDIWGKPVQGSTINQVYIMNAAGTKAVYTYSVPSNVTNAVAFDKVAFDGVYEYVENKDGSIYFKAEPTKTRNVTFGGEDYTPVVNPFQETYAGMLTNEDTYIFVREVVTAGNYDVTRTVNQTVTNYRYSIKKVSDFRTTTLIDNSDKLVTDQSYAYTYTTGSSRVHSAMFGTLLLKGTMPSVEKKGWIFTTDWADDIRVDGKRHHTIAGIDETGAEVVLDLGEYADYMQWIEKGKLYLYETNANGVIVLKATPANDNACATKNGYSWNEASITAVAGNLVQVKMAASFDQIIGITNLYYDANTVIINVKTEGRSGDVVVVEGDEITAAGQYDYFKYDTAGNLTARTEENFVNAFMLINDDTGYIAYIIVDNSGAGSVVGDELVHHAPGASGGLHTAYCEFAGNIYGTLTQIDPNNPRVTDGWNREKPQP